MSWFKVDDGFWSHPKVLTLSDAAVALWLKAGTYSCQHLTDGHIPSSLLRYLGMPQSADELVHAGLWITTDDGYQFHDWDEYQETSDDVKTRREQARERQRKRRAARNSHADVTRDTPRDSQRSSQKVSTPDPTRPDPTRPIEDNPPLSPHGEKKPRQAVDLPDGWFPEPRTVEQIRTEAPHITEDFLEKEHRKFADYWAGIGGARGRKKDWDATWRNWMRRALESQPRQVHPKQETMTAPDRKILGYHEAAERVKAMRERGELRSIEQLG